jgi:hypothetical protein
VKPLEDLPTPFGVLNDKGGENLLKLEGQLSVFLISVLSEKTGLSDFGQQNRTLSFQFLFSADLRTICNV